MVPEHLSTAWLRRQTLARIKIIRGFFLQNLDQQVSVCKLFDASLTWYEMRSGHLKTLAI